MGRKNQVPLNRPGLVVGNYCHDVLIRDDVVIAQTLGGAASFISTVLDGLSISSDYVTKVGPDFAYAVNHKPIISPSSMTTLFHANFSSVPRHHDRILKRVHSCDPILPSDLPDSRFDFGMAVGVAGEILPETLEKMIDICNVVYVDIQALIRDFDSGDGTVKLVELKESGFFHLMPRIGFLKASADEAVFFDIDDVRKKCCVVVTNGKEGCRVYWNDCELQVSPFPTVQVDPTGAGDSFLGGLVAGLVHGLEVPDAALLGNFFGSQTVGHIGLPNFDSRLLQRVKEEVQKRKMQCNGWHEKIDGEAEMMKPLGHDQFIRSLIEANLLLSSTDGSDHPVTNANHKLLLNTNNNNTSITVYDEPIASVETKLQ